MISASGEAFSRARGRQNRRWATNTARRRGWWRPHDDARPPRRGGSGPERGRLRRAGPGLHRGPVDLNLLRGNKVYSGGTHPVRALRLIDQLARSDGELILYSHDVGEARPSSASPRRPWSECFTPPPPRSCPSAWSWRR